MIQLRQRADRDPISEGTQSIDRAVTLLKALAARRSIGWRLTDLAATCGLNDSTVHRIMGALCRAGLARQRERDRHYVVGPLFFEIALTQPPYFRFQAECLRYLQRVARKTGWVASLYLRSREDSVCVQKAGSAPIQTLIDPGARRPLAGSAIGVAMLLNLPEPERQRILDLNRRSIGANPAHRSRAYERMWRRSLEAGLGLNLNDVIEGVSSIGVPLHDSARNVFAAIGVTGITPQFSSVRVEAATSLLWDEAARLEHELEDLIDEMLGCVANEPISRDKARDRADNY